MNYDKSLIRYVNQTPHVRQVGRYYASELYQIIKGYLQPQDFLKPKPIDLIGAKNIIRGEAFEAKLKEIFERNNIKFSYGDDIKKEIKIDDIVLVVKPDFEFKDMVLEVKFPVEPVKEIPEKWIYQLEAEYRATNKTVYLGVFSKVADLTFFQYKPSDARFNLIKKALKDFDIKVKRINTKN